MYFRCMFILDVVYVLSGYCICCNGYTFMLQVYFADVSAIVSRCCICCSGYPCMLQVYVPNVSPISDYVASALSGCYICFM
jgi:hypothetical protein